MLPVVLVREFQYLEIPRDVPLPHPISVAVLGFALAAVGLPNEKLGPPTAQLVQSTLSQLGATTTFWPATGHIRENTIHSNWRCCA